MNFPTDVKYTKDHEWIRVDGDVAYVGITDYAQSELGEIVYVDITTEGETVNKEEVFGTIEAVKTVSDLFMPVTGEVLEVVSSWAVLRICPLWKRQPSFSMRWKSRSRYMHCLPTVHRKK